MTLEDAKYALEHNNLVRCPGIYSGMRREAIRIKRISPTDEYVMSRDGTIRRATFCVVYGVHTKRELAVPVDKLEEW